MTKLYKSEWKATLRMFNAVGSLLMFYRFLSPTWSTLKYINKIYTECICFQFFSQNMPIALLSFVFQRWPRIFWWYFSKKITHSSASQFCGRKKVNFENFRFQNSHLKAKCLGVDSYTRSKQMTFSECIESLHLYRQAKLYRNFERENERKRVVGNRRDKYI